MSFELEPHYDNPFEQAMLDVANILRFVHPGLYESDGETLFAMLVRGTSMYVQAWIAAGASDSLAGIFLTAEDLNDPGRVDDPNATFLSLVDLALDAIRDNIGCELDPNYGRT